jgi:CubicO group peptidase (beta-lactamase class C family)
MNLTRRQALSFFAASPFLMNSALIAENSPPSSSELFPRATAYLRSLIADEQFLGSILMIQQKGKPLFVDIAGLLNDTGHTPMPRDAIFFLASLSKPITGAAALMLIEQGKAKLTDPIDKWIPELANRLVLRRPDGPLDDTYPSPRPMTVQDLMSFRCGYGGDGPSGPFSQASRAANTSPARAATLAPEEFLKELAPVPLQFAPGTHWLYDVPADILGVLIARASGMRYSEFLERNLFGPVGMKDTGFWVPPAKSARIAQYPTGTRSDHPPQVNPLFESGAHGMVSTADDYMRFTQMLLNDGEFNGKRLIKAASVESLRVDRLSPEEHKAGGFLDRYPGRGFGYCGAVWLQPPPFGPSVGSYNWAGASGVWMMVDYARSMTIVIMVQHPSGGPPPGVQQPTMQDVQAQAATPAPSGPPRKKYLPQTVWNDLMQTEIYKDLAG